VRRDPLSARNQEILDSYIREGLIDGAFIPQGEHDRELLRSIESRAYTTWLDRNRNLCALHGPETCRSAFQMRHNRDWRLPDPVFEPLPLLAKPAPDFTPARSILPRGDAWEPPDEDIPPPAEVN
jgi:hypothetical protein